MNEPEDISKLQAFFKTGQTRNLTFRKEQLSKLLNATTYYEQSILDALEADMGKSAFESYATEIGLVREEIRLHRRKLKTWASLNFRPTPLTALPATSYTQAAPYGVSLIISPWNYPFQLSLMPLTAAISAGNCAVIKPSEYSVATSEVVKEMIENTFDSDYIQVVTGGPEQTQKLLKQDFDYIFFTGSTRVGKIVAQAAIEQFIPYTLELGGKSPCIVDRKIDIKQAAKRIVWGKCINAGQTCIAPDYLLVHQDIQEELIKEMTKAIVVFFGQKPIESPDYPKIINRANFERLQQLKQYGKIVSGGQSDEPKLRIAPTFLSQPDLNSPLMQEEIFGPLLPIIPYQDLEEAVTFIQKKSKPLALYIFSANKNFQKTIRSKIHAGGVTINDTLMHFTNSSLPFGGVGASGIGSYHGKAGFDAFSHRQSVMKRATWIDIPVRYPPYGQKIKLLKWLMK